MKVVSRIMATGAEFNKVFISLFRLAISHVPRSGSRDGVSSYGVCRYISSIYGDLCISRYTRVLISP